MSDQTRTRQALDELLREHSSSGYVLPKLKLTEVAYLEKLWQDFKDWADRTFAHTKGPNLDMELLGETLRICVYTALVLCGAYLIYYLVRSFWGSRFERAKGNQQYEGIEESPEMKGIRQLLAQAIEVGHWPKGMRLRWRLFLEAIDAAPNLTLLEYSQDKSAADLKDEKLSVENLYASMFGPHGAKEREYEAFDSWLTQELKGKQ